MRIPATFALENFALRYFVKLYFPFRSAGRRTILMMIRPSRVRFHQQSLWPFVGEVLAEARIGAECRLMQFARGERMEVLEWELGVLLDGVTVADGLQLADGQLLA